MGNLAKFFCYELVYDEVCKYQGIWPIYALRVPF